MSSPVIRAEIPADRAAIHAIHASAFPSDAEARLVDLVRARKKIMASLVAVLDARVVGHILFTPVTVDSDPATVGAGLAPLAVQAEYRRQGIGARLIEAGLAACTSAKIPYAVVLGSPGYYGRFGFKHARPFGLLNEYGADKEFMLAALFGTLPRGGTVRYVPEFFELGV